MRDLDNWLLDQQNNIDNRESNDSKMYLIIFNSEFWGDTRNLSLAQEVFEERKKFITEEEQTSIAELAWIYENDFFPRDIEKTLRLRETIEEFKLMSPKEKAQDIFVKMMEYTPNHIIKDNKDASEICKLHCLIACDEIVSALSYEPPRASNIYQTANFWKEVKEEINSL